MKKKIFLFTPIILLSFFLITLIAFILPTIPQNPKTPNTPNTLPPKFTFRDFLKQTPPIIHNTNPLTLIATGDIMLGRYCNVQMLNNKDWKYPFLKTADLTSSANITFGNLEAPIIENCPTTSSGMIFCARTESVEGLKFAGFDILSLANNHILNYGQTGIEQTINLLNKNNILPSQGNNITIKQFNNLRFGFLSFDLVTYPQTSLIPQISQNLPKADVLIVSLHWGNEYQKEPTEAQKKLAHEIIDAGAKIIIGHHPHVTQPVEEYNGGLIFYSLGNFVFDQNWSEETKKGEIAKIIFEGKNIKSYEVIPIYSENYCLPEISK